MLVSRDESPQDQTKGSFDPPLKTAIIELARSVVDLRTNELAKSYFHCLATTVLESAEQKFLGLTPICQSCVQIRLSQAAAASRAEKSSTDPNPNPTSGVRPKPAGGEVAVFD